ncbi:MAG: hypothetical protein C5B52_02625 [Bacteroidetes bacterium]|nr:MAG: hypothetical protein C5B52_02625 [Bacteroidota bacterium]
MRKILLLPAFMAIYFTALAQAHEATIRFDGKDRPGVILNIPYPPDVVENAINEKFGKEGYKGNNSHGWTVYRNVKLKSLGDDALDVYVKIERKSRQEKDVSEVSIIVARGYSNFVESGSDVLKSSGVFVANVEPLAASMNLEMEIRAQDEILKKSQKKLNDLVSDSLDLDRKKKHLEDGLVENSKKQGEQRDDIIKQQAILDQLKARRKN